LELFLLNLSIDNACRGPVILPVENPVTFLIGFLFMNGLTVKPFLFPELSMSDAF